MNKSATSPVTVLLSKLDLMLGLVKLLVISLVVLGLSLISIGALAQTQMKQATGGTGKYRNSIYWFDFQGLTMNSGDTKTYQFNANGVDITVIIDQLNGSIYGYRPGNYVNAKMDELYNIGGVDGANTLTNAIANISGTQVSLRLRAYATYNGQPASIGLVFGNGEAELISPSNEFTQGTTNGEPWRLLEAGVFNNTTERQITFYNNNQTARLAGFQNVAILYSQKTTTTETDPLTMNAVIRGGGTTAMALGIMTYSERGDAPESYGVAGHLITPAINGGTNPGSGTGNTVYLANPPAGSQLITPGSVVPATTPKLGALPGDFDPSSFTNLGPNADADDLNGQNDEDGVTTFKPLLANATSYSMDAIVGNTSGSPAHLLGWIDFNRNGIFEESEGVAATVPNGATTATLNWTGLSNLTAGQTYARFRISTSPGLTVANPGDVVDNGETEDYTLTIVEPVEICDNGIDDDGNGLTDCDDPACNPYVNYFANGSMENYSQCPNLSQAGTMAYVTSWKTSLPAPAQTGGQLMVNDPAKGCVSPRPAESWLASTNLPAGSDGLAWAGMHGGTPNLGFEDFQNTLIAPLPAGTYTFTFSAGYLVNAPYTAPGYFKFYGVMPGEADFTTAHPLGDSPMINNAISASDPTWKDYSFSFTSTEVYDRIFMVAYSGPAGRSYLVFDGFKMVYNPPVIGFQNPLETCIPDAILKVNNPDPVWVSYQWYMDGVLIPGATEATYQPTTGQLGVFTVSGVLASGCASAPSAGITLGSNCPIPFDCNGSAYLVSTTSTTTPSIIRIVDPANPSTIRATLTPSIADVYNAIGYNFEDNLIYGLAHGVTSGMTPGDIVRIDGEGTVTRLGAPTSTQADRGLTTWTTSGTTNANGSHITLAPGVVGLDNKFYGMVATNNAASTYLVTVDLTTMTYTTVKLSRNYIASDLAFSPYNGMLYGLTTDGLIQTNPNNGEQTVITPTSGVVPAVLPGGAWNDVQGRVYFYANGNDPATGGVRLYRYNPANGVFADIAPVTAYALFDATACFPTRLEKKVIMPATGLNPGNVVEFEFSIYNGQMLPITYDFEDILTSGDLTWVNASVNPVAPGGGTVSLAGNTLRINGITVPPISSTGGLPLTFRVSLKVADNAAFGTCYTNQATIKTGNLTVLSDNPDTEVANDPTGFCLNVPFDCNGSAYLVTTPDGTTPSTIQIVDPANPNTIRATLSPSIADTYNAIGYNFEDNLIYGLAGGIAPSLDAGDIVRFDGQGTVTRLGVPTSTQVGRGLGIWTTSATVNSNAAVVNMAPGVVGLNNKFYGMVTTNVATNTYLVTVDLTTMTYTTVKLSGNYIPADLAFSPYDGMLYGLAGNVLIRTNPNNGNQQAVTVASGTLPANVGAGGAWNDVQGRVYFYANGGTPANGGGRLYRYNPANGVFVNVVAVTPYPGFDATACFPTRLEKKIIMPAGGLKPGDVVEFEFSIYNSQMLPMTYDFEDVLTSTDLTWVNASVNPASPGGGTVTVAGNTLRINGITVAPISSTGGLPLTFRVSLKVADNAAYNTCYTNQATIKTGNITVSSDNPDTEEMNDPTGFCLNPCDVPSPVSGGNQQACVADLNGGKLTATATVPTGTQIIWYDAPTGGNVVADPSLSTAGTITYYAAADDGACVSSRTPVTLSITASPVLDEIEDVASCGPYTLPEIKGTDLSGNAAYYTEANGAGTKYVAGDQLSTLGTTTLYVYDESGRVENCAGSLSVVPNTTYPKSDFDQVANQNTVIQYTGAINPAFWSGTGAQNINYNAADPIVDGQTYPAILGKINIADTDNCFGTDVAISADLSLTNNGPNPGAYGIGYVAIINTATNTRLFQGGLPLVSPVGGTIQGHVEGVVPVADILAGNISFIIVIETYHSGPKNWTLSNFKTGYSFLPEVAENCFDETSFNLTINEIPEVVIPTPDLVVCEPATVDLTAPAVTQGSTAGLTFSYFTDVNATTTLTNPNAVGQTGTYYIVGTTAAGCSDTAAVNVQVVGIPEVEVVHPTCVVATGSIEITAPLGAGIDYSIDGTTYQTEVLFDNLAPGTYNVTARNTAAGCVSDPLQVTINLNPTTPTPDIIQPDCDITTGTVTFQAGANLEYSIDGGAYSNQNVFVNLQPGTYSFSVRHIDINCVADAIDVIITPQPIRPVAPTSGGDQEVCAENPIQTLRASASGVAGTSIVWYDAATGGNLVADPILNVIGTITYYAAAKDDAFGCESLERTPVTLTIHELPIVSAGDDQTQYNNGGFTLDAATTVGAGQWTIVSGTPSVAISDITNPNATI